MHKTIKLDNGLKIVLAPIKGTKTVTALVMVATGSRFEKKEDSGISHFLEHLFFKGTIKRPNTLAISSELDRVGGEFNAFTGKEYTGYYVKVEEHELKLALDVLSDILLNSKFAEEEIKREQGVVIEELNMYQDNPIAYIEDLFESCLYGDTPAGRDTIGAKKNILSFNRERLLGYVGRQYGSDKIIVCLAGRLKPASLKLARRYFSKFKKADYLDKVKTDDVQDRPRVKARFKKTDQAHLSLGVRTFPFSHKDELAAKIISVLLGGTMSSRLFIELRERRGLAYYVRCQQESYSDSGYLTAQAGVPIKKAAEAVKIILAEYQKLTGTMVGEKELNRVKQCLIGRSALRLEASDEVAEWYGRQIIISKEQSRPGRIFTPEKYYAEIKKITAGDINRAAKKIFIARNLNLAVIGPYREKEKKELEKILRL